MTKPRVLMVTRRYWPHVADDAAGRLASLVDGLRRRETHVEVMAARYAASWPTDLTHRESRLHRPAAAPKGEWSMARYLRGLNHALKQMTGAFDLYYADAMREEGAAVVEAARRGGIPSIVHYSGVADSSDAVWWQRSRSGRRCRSTCLTANALIAPHASAEQALVAAGAERRRIHRIEEGFPAAPLTDAAARQAAVSALSDINSDLYVPSGTRVIVCTNRLAENTGVDVLVSALPEILERKNDVAVWLVGDGPLRSQLYDRLRQAGIGRRVAMPGSFSSLQEVFAAADLFVHPHLADGTEYHLPLALGTGLPVVVTRTSEMKRMLGESMDAVTTFAPGDPGSLAASLEYALDTLPQRVRGARQLRQTLLATRPSSATIDHYAKLIRSLTGPSHSSHSSDASAVESTH